VADAKLLSYLILTVDFDSLAHIEFAELRKFVDLRCLTRVLVTFTTLTFSTFKSNFCTKVNYHLCWFRWHQFEQESVQNHELEIETFASFYRCDSCHHGSHDGAST